MSNKKQSLFLGALIGSAGIFLTKFIGMIYGEIEPSQTLTLKKGGE